MSITPGLEDWISHVGGVMRDALPYSLCPALAPRPWDDRRTEQPALVAEVRVILHSLLDELVYDPGSWVLSVHDERDRYVQILACWDGEMIAEVVSNNYLQGDSRWGPADELALTYLGWERPSSDKRPNWRVERAPVDLDLEYVAALVMGTLSRPFGLVGKSPVTLTVYCLPERELTS